MSEPDVVPFQASILPGFPFEPIDDVVVIERMIEHTSTGGIVMPGDGRDFPCGRVVAVGPGRTYSAYMDISGRTQVGQQVPCTLKAGDWVVMGKYMSGGEPIEFGGKKYMLCRQSDIGLRSLTGEAIKVTLAPTE